MDKPDFTLRRFRNGLCSLRFIDMPEFVEAGGDAADWPAFRDNPHMGFVRAPDEVAEGLWKIIIEGTTP